MNNQLFETADRYIDDLFSSQDDALIATEQSIEAADLQNMSVSANQGRFLYVMAKLCRAERILEIGTFCGYSTIWLAKALPTNGRVITLEADETHAAIARDNFVCSGFAPMIDMRIGNALDVLPQLVADGSGPFDMIFIDADKPPYADYFQWALKLSRPGTLIIADNVIRHLYDENTPAEKRAGVSRFNEMLAATPAVTATIIQNVGIKEPDGMAIAVVN